MKILVIDSLAVARFTLAKELRETLRREVLCAASIQESLNVLQVEKDAIGVIILALELGPEAGISFIQKIREFCNAAAIRVPRFLVLTPGPLRGGYENRFRIIGAECLLYGYVQQVCATVQRMIFEALSENGRATIFVDRSGSDPRFRLFGTASSELIRCGPRLLPMMNYFAIHFGTELSTLTLAEMANITVSSVKVYLRRLRARFDEAKIKVGVEIPGSEVFCTLRRDGAFVHILRARVLFN